MPKVSSAEAPEKLRPYIFHGLELKWEGTADAIGECPFCGKPKHFFIAQDTGMWQCKVCGGPSKKGGGNVYNFLRELHQVSIAATDYSQLELVAEERRIPVARLQRWGLVQSAIDKEWLLPGYGSKGIINLYRWMKIGDKRRLSSTATMEQSLFGVQFWDTKKPYVDICEGPWDAMEFEEAVQRYGLKDGKTFRTGNPSLTIFATTNVVAPPGCDQFKEEWAKRFAGKKVRIWFDSDYPKKFPDGHKQAGEIRLVRGKPMVPGFLGMESTAQKLKPVVESIEIIDWGGGGYDTSLPDGFDIRDSLTTELILST